MLPWPEDPRIEPWKAPRGGGAGDGTSAALEWGPCLCLGIVAGTRRLHDEGDGVVGTRRCGMLASAAALHPMGRRATSGCTPP